MSDCATLPVEPCEYCRLLEAPVAVDEPVPPLLIATGVENVAVPLIVGLAIMGDVLSTSEPVPVDVVVPDPPFAAVSGFCRVMLLNVGDG